MACEVSASISSESNAARIFFKLANRQDASLERLIGVTLRPYGTGVDQYVG
jgi:hypothetical protein